MAILNPNKPGWAVVEVNKLQSRTTGNMVANAPLAKEFTCSGKDGAGQTYAENGMILYHDPTSKDGNRYGAIISGETIANGNSGAAPANPTSIGLVWATEHIYDDYNKALSNYKLDRPINPDEEATPYTVPYGQQKHYQFYPRLYMLSSSDTFTTDAVDLGEIADLDALKAAVANGVVYVNVADGYSLLSTTKTDKTYGVVEMVTTLPNGFDPAVKIRVIGVDVALMAAQD